MADTGGDRTPPRALAAAEEPEEEVCVSIRDLLKKQSF
jgi:hypothetical protein